MLDAEGWHMIRDMRERGMSISQIARELNVSRNTVKRHLRINKPLEYRRSPRKTKIDPWKPIIKMFIVCRLSQFETRM
ncbi:MAG: helix-turn-helix domain-containing protein [Thermoplasmata archaeon]